MLPRRSRIVEAGVLAVGRLAGISAAEVAGGTNFAVAFHAEKLDEPGLVLDFLVEDASGHVVRAGVLPKGQIANFAPRSWARPALQLSSRLVCDLCRAVALGESRSIGFDPFLSEDAQERFVLLCTARPLSDVRIETHQKETMRAHRIAHKLPVPLG